jgi:LacI family transcriptional regulator
LRGDPRISRETAQRVLAKARELNYRPNIIARALVRSGSSLVGVVLQDIRGSFFAEIVAGIQEELEARGYNIILCDSDYNEKKEAAHIRTLIDKQIEGMIVNPVNIRESNWGVFQELQDQGIPLILVAGFKEGLDVPYVHGDNFHGGYLAGCHLLDLGHRRMVYFGISRVKPNEIEHSENRDRYEGCLQAVRTQGMNATLEAVETSIGDISPEAMDRLLAIQPRPTGIFAYSDLTAVRLIRQIQERGFQVPRDFSIVGYDDLPIASLVRPP